MSVLGSLTQANPQSYFFALASQGPGAGIQSPASVIPDGTGNTTLALTATGIAGASSISVTGSAGVPGGSGAITVGGFGTVYRAAVLNNGGALQIGLNSGTEYPVIAYDSQTTHQLTLGDRSAVSTASIQTNQPLVVRDYNIDPSGTNGIVLLEDSTTACTITNVAASSGTLNIGSSQAYVSTLVVSDVPKNGASNYILVKGTSGQVPLFVSGAQGPGGDCFIYPDSPGALSTLNIGSSQINPNAISMVDGGVAGSGRTTITNLAPPALANNICTVNGSQAVIGAGIYTIVLPVGVVPTAGLWYFAVNITAGGNQQFQASTIVYYSGTTWSSGGSTQSATDGNGKYIQLYPNGTDMTISYNGAAGSSQPGYVAVTPLFLAPIVGF